MDARILYTLSFVLLTFAFYESAVAVVDEEPYHRFGAKVLSSFSRRMSHPDIWEKHPLSDMISLLTNVVSLDEGEERAIENKLLRLGLPYTAKQYVARGYGGFLIGVLLAMLSFLVGFPFGSVLGFGFGLVLYMRNQDMVNDRIEKLNRMALSELPSFVRTLVAYIGTERDLVRIIKRYLNIAGPGLKRDLEILLMDLNTGNIQVALHQFEYRLAIPEASQLVAILINIDRGVNQDSALENLAANLTMSAREARRRELALRPSRMRKAMLPATFISILAMFYVFLASVINQVSSLFR